MHQALGQALCAPYSDVQVTEPCTFIEVPDGPQTYTPNILWVQ